MKLDSRPGWGVCALLCLQAMLFGCAAPAPSGRMAPARTAVPVADAAVATGPIALPSGIDLRRMKALDEGQTLRVYVNLVGIGDSRSDASLQLLFPQTRASAVGTSAQLNRRFVDMVRASNRFEIFEETASGVRSASAVVVDGMVVYAGQRWQVLLAQQKAVTTVRLSVQIRDNDSGEIIPPNLNTITGNFGNEAGEGTLMQRGMPDAALQDSLAADFDRALEESLSTAAALLELRMRPLGRVTETDDRTVALFGGERHGLQPGDMMVVFRPRMATLGGKRVMTTATPLALVRCDSVQVEVSQCQTLRLSTAGKVQMGDYAVLADESLKLRMSK